MDVRCERCRAQYTVLEDQIAPGGATVECTVCGHQFLVRPPALAPAAAPRFEPLPAAPPALPPPTAAPRPWSIRQASGQTLSFAEVSTLQLWIVERKVTREDEVTRGDGAWVRLGTLAELQPFFEVVEAADRAQGRTTSRYPPPPPTWGPTAAALPAPGPAPSSGPPTGTGWAPLPPGPAPTPPYALPVPGPDPARQRTVTAELDEADLRAVGRSSRSRTVLLAVLFLLVAGAALAYVFLPALFGRAPPTPSVATPVAAAARPPEPAPPPPPPEPRPEPEARPAAPEPTPEPPAVQAPAPTAGPRPAPPTTRQQLAEARRLREGGKAEQALDLYGRIVAEEPGNAEALAGRGLCYFDLDQHLPAEASLLAALRVSPTQPDALLGLAETYRAMGRTAEAITQFERYLAAHPGGDEAAVARNAINQLKERP